MLAAHSAMAIVAAISSEARVERRQPIASRIANIAQPAAARP